MRLCLRASCRALALARARVRGYGMDAYVHACVRDARVCGHEHARKGPDRPVKLSARHSYTPRIDLHTEPVDHALERSM
eukprot:2304377-Alexandrium_andersonii.AAC.1